MKITVLCVGKIKEKFFKDAISEYEKRLSRYCKLEFIEVADEKAPEKISAKEESLIREKEGERLLKHIHEEAYIITLEIDGKELDSVEFAKKLEGLGVAGVSQLCFVIGGSIGLGESVRKKANFALSFSHMTFPHQLMRVVLLEQIYRGYRIMKGEPYHK